MEFRCEEELQGFINNLNYLNMGSQGTCYLINNIVIKIFHDYMDNDNMDEFDILKYSKIKNNTFIWPDDVIKLNGNVIGYRTKYVKAKNLYKLSPLKVNLDKLCKSIKESKNDIKLISNQGIVTYDMMYNTLYNGNLYCIDQDRYSYSDKDPSIIEKNNNIVFNTELYYFLVDNYFNSVIKNNKELNELYTHKDEDILIFIELFRKYLSELVDSNITNLGEAKKYVKKTRNIKYFREL